MTPDDQTEPAAPAAPGPVVESDEPRRPAVPPPGTYVARAGRYFRNVRYIIFAAAFGAGLWFLYDGFVGWPAERAEFHRLDAEVKAAQERGEPYDHLLEQQKQYKDHNDASILLQKILGLSLPPLAVLLLIRWLYISRGEIRMDDGDTLHAPGHPPIPASAVTEIDDSLWDRKGIAYVDYTIPGGESGQVRLDDFVYERPPVDAIHDRLVYLLSQRH